MCFVQLKNPGHPCSREPYARTWVAPFFFVFLFVAATNLAGTVSRGQTVSLFFLVRVLNSRARKMRTKKTRTPITRPRRGVSRPRRTKTLRGGRKSAKRGRNGYDYKKIAAIGTVTALGGLGLHALMKSRTVSPPNAQDAIETIKTIGNALIALNPCSNNTETLTRLEKELEAVYVPYTKTNPTPDTDDIFSGYAIAKNLIVRIRAFHTRPTIQGDDSGGLEAVTKTTQNIDTQMIHKVKLLHDKNCTVNKNKWKTYKNFEEYYLALQKKLDNSACINNESSIMNALLELSMLDVFLHTDMRQSWASKFEAEADKTDAYITSVLDRASLFTKNVENYTVSHVNEADLIFKELENCLLTSSHWRDKDYPKLLFQKSYLMELLNSLIDTQYTRMNIIQRIDTQTEKVKKLTPDEKVPQLTLKMVEIDPEVVRLRLLLEHLNVDHFATSSVKEALTALARIDTLRELILHPL